MNIKCTYILVFLLLFCSCSGKKLKPADYVHYIEQEEHGFIQSLSIAGWDYEAQYRPPAHIYLSECGGKADKTSLEKRKEQLAGWMFFKLSVAHHIDHHASPIRLISTCYQDYNDYLSYYLGDNKKNFKLMADSSVYYPSVYLFENNYNLSPKDVFVLGFKTDWKKIPDQIALAYHDEMLKTGIMRFVFQKKDLDQEPELLLN